MAIKLHLQQWNDATEICDLSNSIVKSVKPPIQKNEIFYNGSGTASQVLSSTSTAVLYNIQQGKKVAEITTPPVKYVAWSNDGTLVALLSKHTITIANKNFSQSSLIHETVRIKSGAWNDSGVLIYSTLNHIKYCLPQGDTGVIRTFDNPVNLTRVKGSVVHCLDHSARPRTIAIDTIEYRFKLALLRHDYQEMLHIIKTLNLVGQSIIAYLQRKGYPEIALCFVEDKKTRSDLDVECGNLDVALEMANAIDRPESWNRLAQQALKQGNHKIVEKAYRTGCHSFINSEKLSKMQKIAESRGDPMSRFHNALYASDVESQVAVLRVVRMCPLAYLMAKTNGLSELTQEILDEAGLNEVDVDDVPDFGTSTLKPPCVVSAVTDITWLTLVRDESYFDRALANGNLEADGDIPYVNGIGGAAASSALDDWAREEEADEVDPEGGG